MGKKIKSLEELKERGMNTPELLLTIPRFGKTNPILWETNRARWVDKKIQRVSIRTEGDEGDFKCPHFPNITLRNADRIVQELWKRNWEIHVFKGINPDQCLYKGNIVDTGEKVILEYLPGPGTVRDLEKEVPKVRENLEAFEEPFNIVAVDFRANVPQRTILEFSIYKKPVGYKNEKVIYWEMRPWQ